MISLFTNYQKFSVKEVKKQNDQLYNRQYNEYNKQNSKEAIECFLDLLNAELCKDVMARIGDDIKFSKIFMIFIKHEQPQHRELYDTIKQRLQNIDVGKFPGANIKDMCFKMCKDIKALIKANKFDSKHNAKICRILTEAGGLNNSENSNPTYAKLTKVKKEIPKYNHMSNTDKLKAMTQAKVGLEEILRESQDMYKSMTDERSICWPPACSLSDTKVTPNHFGANLTQYTNGKQANTNHKSLLKKMESTRTGTEITSKAVTEVTIIVTTRRSLGMEEATKMHGKLNLPTRQRSQ